MGSSPSKEEIAAAAAPKLVDNPTTAAEALLYTATGQQCVYKDSMEFNFRLRQLATINHAVTVMAKYLGGTNNIDFKAMHQESMTYKDSFGNPDTNGDHDWKIIADDPFFKSAIEEYNIFKQYQYYFDGFTGNSVDTTTGKQITAVGGASRQARHLRVQRYKMHGGGTIEGHSGQTEAELKIAFTDFQNKFMKSIDSLTRKIVADCVDPSTGKQIDYKELAAKNAKNLPHAAPAA